MDRLAIASGLRQQANPALRLADTASDERLRGSAGLPHKTLPVINMAEAKMAIEWDDLTQDEQETVAALYPGAFPLLTKPMAKRLKELGLTEQKIGGTALSDEGRKLYEHRKR
jgi:hypothetical protein